MLVRERKRALWSLGIGVILAVTVEGTLRILHWQTTRRLEASIADCEKPGTAVMKTKAGNWKETSICKPDDLREIQTKKSDGTYTPMMDEELISGGVVTAQIIRDDEAAKAYHDSVILLLLSAVPFVWYFFLDRIREFSVAVSGRDRTL